jgi:hypothetical protein
MLRSGYQACVPRSETGLAKYEAGALITYNKLESLYMVKSTDHEACYHSLFSSLFSAS